MKYQWAQIFRSLVPYWPTHLSVWLYYPPLTRRLTVFLDHYYFAPNFGFLVAQVLVFDGGVNFDEMTHVFKWFLLTKVPTNPNYHNCRAQKDQKVLFQTTFRNRMNLKNQFLNGTEWISRFSCSNFSLIFFLLSLFILLEAKMFLKPHIFPLRMIKKIEVESSAIFKISQNPQKYLLIIWNEHR